MNQSSAIFAFLAMAFVVFITQRGELRTYMGFLFGNVSQTPTNSVVNTKGEWSVSDVVGVATTVAPLVL